MELSKILYGNPSYSENVNGVCATYDFNMDNEFALESGENGNRLEYENRWTVESEVSSTMIDVKPKNTECPEARVSAFLIFSESSPYS